MDYEGFKSEIYKLTRINLSCYKEKQMKRRIDSLIKKNRYTTYDSYLKAIKSDEKLFHEFINYLTINVSEFFRNPPQWEILKSEIIPFLLKNTKNLKIWSAACSTGDEPYSIVMILAEFMPLQSIRILATDIDNEAMEKAKRGIYYYKSLEGLPQEYKDKYFYRDGEYYHIDERIKRCVDFQHHNLLEDPYPRNFDLIACRNALIYFTEEAKSDIYLKFNKSLKTNGILFVGSTEQIIYANKYGFKPIKTFFYLKETDIGDNT